MCQSPLRIISLSFISVNVSVIWNPWFRMQFIDLEEIVDALFAIVE